MKYRNVDMKKHTWWIVKQNDKVSTFFGRPFVYSNKNHPLKAYQKFLVKVKFVEVK